MKRWLTLTLVLVALAGVLTDLGVSKQQDKQKIPPTSAVVATKPSATADLLLAKACDGKKTDDTVKVRGKKLKCPPRLGVKDRGTPADIKYIKALAAACARKNTNDNVKVSGVRTKCPSEFIASARRAPTDNNPVPPRLSVIHCSPSSSWSGWSRCCKYTHTYMSGWELEWCAWTQN